MYLCLCLSLSAAGCELPAERAMSFRDSLAVNTRRPGRGPNGITDRWMRSGATVRPVRFEQAGPSQEGERGDGQTLVHPLILSLARFGTILVAGPFTTEASVSILVLPGFLD